VGVVRAPWRSIGSLEPDAEYVVLASHIPARRYSATPALFGGARAVRHQLARTPGVIGYSLLARPARKQYASLSVWSSEEALATFAGSEPHRRLMSDLRPAMSSTTFVRWTIHGRDGRPRWRDALRRLEEAERRDRGMPAPPAGAVS
jgi:hypothetical protein